MTRVVTIWGLLISAGALLKGQNVGIGTSTPQTRLHVHGAGGVTGGIRVTSTGTNSPTVNFYAGTATPDAGHISFGDNTGWKFHITRASDGTNMVTVQDNGNVGIGTTTPAQRLHVVGKAIVDDATTGAPAVGTWGGNGSRIILWPGTATAHPYQFGIDNSTLWAGVPDGAYFTVFRGAHRQFIISPNTAPFPGSSAMALVSGSTNFPSIFIGTLTGAFSAGPFPKRGTFLVFGGPSNSYEYNTDPAVMYHCHLNSDVTRLRIHAEDNECGGELDGISFLGNSCGGGSCNDLAYSSLQFDFVTSCGQAYKPGGGDWATLSDRRIKEDIRPYLRGLAELRALQPVRYRYKKQYWAGDREFVGLIAQEVQEVVPEMVHWYKMQVPGDSLVEVLALDPSDLTYMLINAVKDLDAENQQLRARVAALEAEKAGLEARLSLIEARLSGLEGAGKGGKVKLFSLKKRKKADTVARL